MKDLTSDETLELLFSYMPRIAAERQLDSLLVLMADLGRSLVAADRCSLWLIDEHRHELWTKVAHGVQELRIPLDKGFVGYVVKTGQSLLIADAHEDPRWASTDNATHYRTKAVLTVPLENTEGKVIGVYQALNKMTESEEFSKEDLEHLRLAAVYSAKVVESAILNQELEDTQKEIIFMLGEVAEIRSKETGNHVKRVAESCYLLAKYYGLSEFDAQMIKMAAPMHDVGKVGIPDAILQKQGAFTPEEVVQMQRHTILGYEMLAHSRRKLLQLAAIMAKTHHEYWDGNGKPEGLKGEEIPLEGRICAVADVFDALSSDRCYKKGWPAEKVKEFFLEKRDQQFQAEFVDILLEHWDEFWEINQKLSDHFFAEEKVVC